jgi:hypothetical protein
MPAPVGGQTVRPERQRAAAGAPRPVRSGDLARTGGLAGAELAASLVGIGMVVRRRARRRKPLG